MEWNFVLIIDFCSATDADETAKYDIMVKGVQISPSPIVRGRPINMTFNLIIGTPKLPEDSIIH